MLIEHIVVESSIPNSKASELSGVTIRVSTALDGCLNESMSQKLLIEEPCMTTKVSNQVTDLSSD